MRDESYLDTIPEEHKPVFVDENPVAPAKIKVLKDMIQERFPVRHVLKYSQKLSYLILVQLPVFLISNLYDL